MKVKSKPMTKKSSDLLSFQKYIDLKKKGKKDFEIPEEIRAGYERYYSENIRNVIVHEKPKKEKTIPIRVPESLLPKIKELIKSHKK